MKGEITILSAEQVVFSVEQIREVILRLATTTEPEHLSKAVAFLSLACCGLALLLSKLMKN